MFKKFMCLALSIMMVLCTVSTTGFAASYEADNLVASHVSFTADGKASINVANNGTEADSVVFWLGEYVNGVLVESDFVKANIDAAKNADLDLSIAKDEGSVLKAYIWKDVVGGKPIAPVATYPSSSTEILYATKGGETWAEFDAATLTYDVLLERTQFNIPEFKLYAKDNSTQIIEPDEFAVGKNEITVKAADGTEVKYEINISYQSPTVTIVDQKFDSAAVYMGDKVVEPGTVAYTDRNTFILGHVGTEILGASYFKYPTRQTATTGVYKGTVSDPIYTFTADAGATVYILARDTRTTYANAGWELISSGNPGISARTVPYDESQTGWEYWASISQWATDAAAADWKNQQFDEEGNPNKVYKSDSQPDAYAVEYPGYFSAAYKKHFDLGEEIVIYGTGSNNTGDYDFVCVKWDEPEPFDTADAALKSLSYTLNGEAKAIDISEGYEFDVEVPTGTSKIDAISAEKNIPYSKITGIPENAVTLTDGKATVTITVTSFDQTVTNEYKINFIEKAAQPDDATLKKISYVYGGTAADVEGFAPATESYTVDLPAGVTEIYVSAEASVGNGNAKVEITQPVVENYKATAAIVVTAIDGTTQKTYMVTFNIERALSDMPNKIYDLVSAKDPVITDNNSYQTDKQAAETLTGIVIGENLTNKVSPRIYDRVGEYYAFDGVSADMEGASYLRLKRNHGSIKSTVSTQGKFTRQVGDGAPQELDVYNGGAGDFANGTGFRILNPASGIPFFSGAFSGKNEEPGWIEFKVSSDCTVVVGDLSNKGYPNIKNDPSWTVSDGSTNKVNGTSYYKSFKAGDTVVIPNYGISSGPYSDQTPVIYRYTDTSGNPQVFETTLANDSIAWDDIVLAVKWSATLSSNADLAEIKVNGTALPDFAANKTDYVVTVDKGVTSVSLSASAADAAAEVNCPATVSVGGTATITVTAEDKKTVKTYKVKVIDEDPANAQLKSFKYIAGGAAAADVTGFNASDNGGSYTVAPFDYVKGGVAVTLAAETLISGASVSYEPASITVSGTDAKTIKAIVESADSSVTKEYTVSFSMKEFAPTISNVAGATSDAKVFRVVNAKKYGIEAGVTGTQDEINALFDKANAQIAADGLSETNGINGSCMWNMYPKFASGKIDNPNPFADTDTQYIINSLAYVLRVDKGANVGQAPFGTAEDFITFDVNAPGTMYCIESNGYGFPTGLNAGFEKLSGVKLASIGNIYAKHFDAGKVSVPAQGCDEAAIAAGKKPGERIPNTMGFVFVFDDASDATLLDVKFSAGGKDYTFPAGDSAEIAISGIVYTGEIEITATPYMSGTTVEPVKVTLTNGNGTAKVVAVSEDGKTTKEYNLTFTNEPYKIAMPTKGAGVAWLDTIYGDPSANVGKVHAVDGLVIGTTYRYCDRVGDSAQKVSGSANLTGATYIRMPKNEASPSMTDVTAYANPETGERYFLRQVEGADPVKYTSSYTGTGYGGPSGTIGFRKFSRSSVSSAFVSGAYDGTDGNYWITFRVTSDCTVVVADGIGMGYPNLDRSLWKNNTNYRLINGADKTYVRHFNAGDVVQIPNYGLTDAFKDTRKVTYTYWDSEGKQQTYETTVANDTTIWEDISFAIVWDDKAIDNDAKAITVNGALIDGFAANVKDYEYVIPYGAGKVTVAAEAADSAAKVSGIVESGYAAGDVAEIVITSGSGAENKYTITFKAGAAPSSDSTLSALTYQIGEDEAVSVPNFDAAKKEYVVTIPAGTASVTVAAAANDEKSSVVLTQADLTADEKTATVVVTAEDGSTSTYKVSFVFAVDDSLAIAAFKYKTPVDSAFVYDAELKGDGTYYIEVASNIESIEIEVTPKNASSVAEYVKSAIALTAGEIKTEIVKITAGTEYKEYTLNIKRNVETDIGGNEDGGDI